MMYDYGWRQYMPDIGKWNGMDQLAENYLSHSPYAYVMNNPIMMTDPDGRQHLLTQAYQGEPDRNTNPQQYTLGGGGRSDAWNSVNNWSPITSGSNNTLGGNTADQAGMDFLYGDSQGTFYMTNHDNVMRWWTDLGKENQGVIFLKNRNI